MISWEKLVAVVGFCCVFQFKKNKQVSSLSASDSWFLVRKCNLLQCGEFVEVLVKDRSRSRTKFYL